MTYDFIAHWSDTTGFLAPLAAPKTFIEEPFSAPSLHGITPEFLPPNS
jgi:hypothetical protein